MATVSCLECGQVFDLYDPLQEGQKVTCPSCHARMEIIHVDPLELDWAYLDPPYLWEGIEMEGIEW
jgi:uncharacterized paraquat-inducible protein A